MKNNVLKFGEKIRDSKIEKLTLKEIESFIDEHWLEWTCKYGLSSMGDLTLTGKRNYIKTNRDEILGLMNEFDSDQ